jgi:hypothetical protein
MPPVPHVENQIVPSAATTAAWGSIAFVKLAVGNTYERIVPAVVMLAIEPGVDEGPDSANQRLPSAPDVIYAGFAFVGKSVQMAALPSLGHAAMLQGTPPVVVQPMMLLDSDVNQTFPSLPEAMPRGA